MDKRINEIVNRLNKTKTETKQPDLREEREERDREERDIQKAERREEKQREKEEGEKRAKETERRSVYGEVNMAGCVLVNNDKM